MLPGISTACFYPMQTEQALAQYAKWGVQSAEVFLNSSSELEPRYLKELRAVADGAGIRLLSVHPFTSGMEPMLFFSQYDRRFQDGRDSYRRYYEAANILGAGIVVFHGNILQFPIDQAEYFRRFSVLMEDAAAFGVKLCHENVSRCTGCRPAFFREMSAALPDARFVLDLKQALRAGEDVFDFVQAMGKKVEHVHISDHNSDNQCLPMGTGVLHTQEFLSALRNIGFSGGVVVELYRDSFGGAVELLHSYQHLCDQLSTVTQNQQRIF